LGSIAGTLDAIAAIVLYASPVNLHTSTGIFRYISSGIFGKTVYSGGIIYPLVGLVMHYGIATVWSSVYVMILFRIFKPGYVWIKIILFSCAIWMVMNGLILPLAGFTSGQSNVWSIFKSFSAILLCVGFPICLITEKKAGSI
jgi:hypothetical protein